MSDGFEQILRACGFIALALALCAAIFQAAGYSAFQLFESILDGAFLQKNAWAKSLRWALPLFISAVGVGISFRCGFFNIGAQGQFYVGAVCAAFTADALAESPAALAVPLGILTGMAGGALWSLWPGYLRLKYGTDEVITTLMGNFIASLFLTYVTAGPLKDPSGSGQQASTRIIPESFRISDSQGVSLEIFAIAAVVAALAWFLVNRTAFGALSSLAGRNPAMLNFQGANIWKLGLASFAISGALAGLAGSIELFGPNGRIASGFLPSHGFTAILVALVANFAVAATAVASLFFGGLISAAIFLPILAGLPASAIDLINASIALFITAKFRLGNRIGIFCKAKQ